MPTTLPDLAFVARQQRRLTFAKLAPFVVAVFYLLLLGWSALTLEANSTLLFGDHHRQGEYSPMEPNHPIADRRMAAVAGAH
jgi:hypothetical protein